MSLVRKTIGLSLAHSLHDALLQGSQTPFHHVPHQHFGCPHRSQLYLYDCLNVSTLYHIKYLPLHLIITVVSKNLRLKREVWVSAK